MILTTLIDIGGTAGWVLLLLPYAVLLLVAATVILGRDRAATEQAGMPLSQEQAPDERTVAGGVELRHAERSSRDAPPSPLAESAAGSLGRAPSGISGEIASRPASADSAAPPTAAGSIEREVGPQFSGAERGAASKTPPASKPPWGTGRVPATTTMPNDRGTAAPTTADLELLLVAAEQRFDDAEVARLSLALARELIVTDGPGTTAQSHLRRAIILASRLGDNDTHAAARLELGDLLGAEGDMTTACEHWQIARQIFWDGGDKNRLADADRRMIANGCPTDWVLNDF
ncbi:MAG: hypothetical protein H6876_07910 [Hyphomicrobiaceae bacterium]|nr:hypothetical protein [Hyphomicrobiaceae bacterium]MCC0008031.1 hypothetical protein [Hyphomicrobiaceae bacterium]